MTSRTSRTSRQPTRGPGPQRTAVVLVAMAALAGCQFHPGSAAVVNGDKISQGTIDDLVVAGCGFFKAQRALDGGAVPSTSTAFLRNVFTGSLISFTIVDKAAAQLHLTVSRAAIASATQTPPKGMNSEDRERLADFFTDSARSELQQAVIGAHLKDPSVTNADDVTPDDTAAAEKYLAAFTAKQHVEVNPAYGTWSGGRLLDTDGSLSKAQSSEAKSWLALRAGNGQSAAGLPASQVCG